MTADILTRKKGTGSTGKSVVAPGCVSAISLLFTFNSISNVFTTLVLTEQSIVARIGDPERLAVDLHEAKLFAPIHRSD